MTRGFVLLFLSKVCREERNSGLMPGASDSAVAADIPAPVNMTMRRAQRKVLAMACAVVLCMLLFCPWVIKSRV